MSKNVMNLTRQIRIKAAKKLAIPTFEYKPSERRRDSNDLHYETLVVEKNLGESRMMNQLKDIVSNICAELNKNDREINYQRLLNLCDTVLRNL
jgi:hypothetical protein